MRVQWWCSAQGVRWSWSWRPYPGVWVMMALLVALYWRMPRQREAGEGRRAGRCAAAGLFVLWLSLDWPVAALGAGYLASAHMVQYLSLSFVAVPLLLLGVPRAAYRALGRRRRVLHTLRPLTRPTVTLLVFETVAVVTHVPRVVDWLMVSQLGSFAFDMAWLVAALLFWWPMLAPVPHRPEFSPPARLLYLFLSSFAHVGIAVFLVFSRYPVYSLYETAPPTGWISASGDQHAAGAIMWVIGGIILLGWFAGVFLNWMRDADSREPVPTVRP